MKILTTIIIVLLGIAIPTYAAADDELAKLKQDLLLLVSRVENLEAENLALKTSSAKAMAQAAKLDEEISSKASWSDSITLKGDFRYRYENIDSERSDTRERNRIRGRVALVAKPAADIEIGLGFASGGDDPVSSNQTLGGGGSTKDLRLDLAYFDWHGRPGLHVVGGKMKNLWFKPGGNSLLWDGDFRPEGLALTYEGDNFFVNTGAHFLESDTKSGNSKITYGIQSGYAGNTPLGKVVAGVGYFDIRVEGRTVYFGDDDDFFGNTFNCTDPQTLSSCTYNNDYEEVEVFVQLSTNIGETPVSVFADYVQNQDAGAFDTAWATGVKLGKASNRNSWEFAWIYQDVEADAVFGLTNDSDFGGGGTDTKGHVFKGAWALNKKWKVGFTYLMNERNVDFGTKEDYDRLQVDSSFKF